MKRINMFVVLTPVIIFFGGCACNNIFFNPGYNIKAGKVYYKNAFPNGAVEVFDADAKSFKIVMEPRIDDYNVSSSFGTDKAHVFYAGYMIAGSDGKSFTILDRNFSKDKNQCYYNGKIIENADPSSFTVKDESFSADKNNVYKGEMLMDNNSSLFESFDSSSIVHTVNALSVFEKVIPLLPTNKFKFIRYNYYAINDTVYFQDKPMPDADVSSFKALDNFFSKTAGHVYYGDKIIENAKPLSYQLLPSPYGTDGKHIFFFEKTIEGADPRTFEILNINFQCSRDKHWAYHEEKRIKNVTPEDMANTKKCRQCNEEAIYFEEN